jgi:hypothetical protein
MSDTAALPEPCQCGQGPNLLLCPAGHVERSGAKPGGSTKCPHRDSVTGARCARYTKVPKAWPPGSARSAANRPARGATVQIAVATERADQDAPGWAAEGSPARWHEILGGECPGERCTEAAGCSEGCSGQPWRYTRDHTAIVCPDPKCWPWCWEISPAARLRAREHDAEVTKRAHRAGAATVAVPQPQIDARARAVRRLKADMLPEIDQVLARDLTPDSRSDYEWFRGAVDAAATTERLDELDRQMTAEPPRYRSRFRRVLDRLAPSDDADDIVDAEVLDDDQDQDQDQDDGTVVPLAIAAMPGPFGDRLPPAVIARLTGLPSCERCHARGQRPAPFAVTRIASNAPELIAEEDLCAGCFAEQRQFAGRMTYVRIWTTQTYQDRRAGRLA